MVKNDLVAWNHKLSKWCVVPNCKLLKWFIVRNCKLKWGCVASQMKWLLNKKSKTKDSQGITVFLNENIQEETSSWDNWSLKQWFPEMTGLSEMMGLMVAETKLQRMKWWLGEKNLVKSNYFLLFLGCLQNYERGRIRIAFATWNEKFRPR